MAEENIDKLTFEKENFKFVAAYNVYSSRFEETDDPGERTSLNELISKLESEEIEYPSFYKSLAETDGESDRRYQYHRVRIEGSRKFAYRRSQQKKDRIKRHKR
jgi:hypothetical protein